MADHAELRAALSDGSFDFDQRAYMNDVRALLAERDALIHDNSEYVSAANELATDNQRLREAVTAFIEYADNHGEITFAGGGMRAVDVMNSVVRIARAALSQEQGGRMNIEQERAAFEAWFTKTKAYISGPKDIFAQIVRDAAWESWQARAALQSQPKANDMMLSGVLRMPFDMAMASELSRIQFYQRAQQALNELEALQSQDREDAERLDWLLRKLPGDAIRYCVGVLDDTADAEEFRAAIDHARRVEGGAE